MTTLSVVIPAYNEEKGIADILSRVLSVQDELHHVGIDEMELLVVDDGSKDQTAEIITNLGRSSACIKLIRHPINKGYGAALKTGFANAKGELIAFLDADGTYPPEYFPHLCKEALNGCDLVVGSRMAGATSEMPMTRRIGNFFFANLLTLLSRERVSDSASGMRVFKREVLARVYPLPDGLNLTPVMSAKALHEGIKVTEVAIPYRERVGRSKLSVVRDGSIFLRSMVWTVLEYNPVRILGALGLGGVGVAGLVFIGLLIARLSGIRSLGPWGIAAVYLALISAVAGISLFSLGATFNYLVALFYKRPIRQGLFGRPLFSPSLDHYFGYFGAAGLFTGLGISLVSLYLGINGWDISRIWLYLVSSAMLVLVGVQLLLYWILMRVLEALSQREILAEKDMKAV